MTQLSFRSSSRFRELLPALALAAAMFGQPSTGDAAEALRASVPADGVGMCVPRPQSGGSTIVIGGVEPAEDLVLSPSETARLVLELSREPSSVSFEASSNNDDIATVHATPDGRFDVTAVDFGETTLTLTAKDTYSGEDDSVVVAVVVQPAQGAAMPGGVVFETDFEADIGYQVGQVTAWNKASDGSNDYVPPPTGWDGIRIGPEGIAVVPEGRGGSAALRVSYRGVDRASITLGRHLTGKVDEGFDELYIRYSVKLPPNFHKGSGPFWKWGRFWQNTTPEINESWSELRDDAGYVVWGISSGWKGNSHFYAAVADNDVPGNHKLGSNGGPMQLATWYRAVPDVKAADGFFEGVGNGAWALADSSGTGFLADRSQRYHTIEWHFKLATSADAEDGAFRVWIDGVEWMPFTYMQAYGGAPTRAGIPTVSEGAGFNHLSLFDNMQGWAREWGRADVDGYVLIDDVVVSTERIGHDYAPRGTTPIAPR